MDYIESKSTERKFKELRELGQKLGIPIFESFIEFEVTMPNGEVVHHHKQRSHSWVRNAYNLMMSQLGGINGVDLTFGAGLINYKITNGNIAHAPNIMSITGGDVEGIYDDGYRGPAGDAARGIIVGSSIQAESFEDYMLITPIISGTGAGQLHYQEGVVPTKSYDIPSKTYSAVHVRYMNNNSAGNVLVNEIALVSSYYCVVSRDHIGSTITIPSTGQLKVTYTISLVYPA